MIDTLDDDVIYGTAGPDFIRFPLTGDDTVYGGAGNDDLWGSDRSSYLDGGAGDDSMRDWLGFSTMVGGDGNDSYYVSDARTVILESGSGNDTVYLNYLFSNFTLPATVENIVLGNVAAEAKITGNSLANIIDGYNNTIGAPETLFGMGGNDSIRGLDGHDLIYGGDGDDDVNGNRDNDTVYGGAGNDIVRGGQQNDVVYGEGGDDGHVNGNIGNDTVYGGVGNDVLFGGQNDDLLLGEVGNDTLSGDLGNDTLTGGAGADCFIMGATTPGADTVTDFVSSDGDRIQLAAGVTYTVSAGSGGAVLNLSNGGSLTLAGISASTVDSAWVLTA